MGDLPSDRRMILSELPETSGRLGVLLLLGAVSHYNHPNFDPNLRNYDLEVVVVLFVG